MRNAHLRFGKLEYVKAAASNRSTSTHVTVAMDRLILEPAPDPSRAPLCHLLSVFGGEQETAAIHAAIADRANFRITGPDLSDVTTNLGEGAHTFRGLLQAPGRKQPVRHLVALSHDLFETQAGSNLEADRTVVYSADPDFLVYRLSVRFGIPVLPCWCAWIAAALKARNMIRELPGLGCRPALVQATKQALLEMIAGAVKTGILQIPHAPKLDWNVAQSFSA